MRPLRTLTFAATALLSVSVAASSVALGDERTTSVLKQKLQGMEGMEANILLFEVDPGFQTERHIHPGHLFIYVLEGAIEIKMDGQDPIRVSAGEAVYETPNMPMVGRNASATDGARFVVFQMGEAGEPLTVAQPE